MMSRITLSFFKYTDQGKLKKKINMCGKYKFKISLKWIIKDNKFIIFKYDAIKYATNDSYHLLFQQIHNQISLTSNKKL